MTPLVDSPKYDISAFGLERLHPFDGQKYGRLRDWLVRHGLRKPRGFAAPRPSTHAGLLRVRTPDYLGSLRDRRVLAGILEMPLVRRLSAWRIAWKVLRRSRRWAHVGFRLLTRISTLPLAFTCQMRLCFRKQQFLNFLPLPQGQGALRPTFCSACGLRGSTRAGAGAS